jgi:hypothetical protein
MAKRRRARKTAVPRRRAAAAPASPVAAAAAAAAAGPLCKLRPDPNLPQFEAATGDHLRLFTHDHIGLVLIAKAEYAGTQLVPAGQAVNAIELDVLAGRNTLKLVFVFSASTNGQGELREDCGGGESQLVRPLVGDEPLQLVKIIGR